MKLRSIISSLVIASAIFTSNAHAFNLKDSLKKMVLGNNQQQGQYNQQGYTGGVYNRVGIENTNEWQDFYKLTSFGFDRVDQEVARVQPNRVCGRAEIEQLSKDPVFYEFNINTNLPKLHSGSTQVFEVNTFYKLNQQHYVKNDGNEAVYIPNINNIKYLTSHVYVKSNQNSVSQNASAIMVPSVIAQLARQQFNMQGRRPEVDIQNLREATLRDVATYAYLIFKNPQYGLNAEDFIKSSFLLYMRNKINCEYDVLGVQPQPVQYQQPQIIQPLPQGYYVPPQQQQYQQQDYYNDQAVRINQQYESR